jgi:DNA-binding PadR family transcriptional regulator
MARSAVSELQQQIEAVRREAFAAGYTAAMQAIREFASRPATDSGPAATRRSSRGGARRKTVAVTPSGRRQTKSREGVTKTRRSAASRPQRGSNAQSIEEVLQAAAPRALRQAEIRKALQDKGLKLAFTSIRHALGQLEARNSAEQVGETRTWRHRGSSS